MICPKCSSEKVSVQVVTETKLKDKHHGILWWLFWGWYWIPIKWLIFTLPALIITILKPKRQKAVSKQSTVCCCQSCGYTWNK